MKKAKIMLAVIAVLAIVGGALAFRAKTLTESFAFSCVAPHGGFEVSTCNAYIPDALHPDAVYTIDESANPQFVTTGTFSNDGTKQGVECRLTNCDQVVSFKEE